MRNQQDVTFTTDPMIIDFCIEEDGFIDISSPDDQPIDHIRALAILEEEAVTPGHYGEIYLEPTTYTIDIHQS